MTRALFVTLLSLSLGASALTARGLVPATPAGCELARHVHVPAHLPDSAPLVVVLHGCAHSAEQMAREVGWNELADRHGFCVLYPEQPRCANPLGCFNWFEPHHTARGQGEMKAIKAMVDQVRAERSIDPARIYVTGFSAGGAMAVALMSCYPEIFAGGAVMSGLPYRIASGAAEGFIAMSMSRDRTPKEWGDLVRGAVPGYPGRYPPVVVFHGQSDRMVVPANARELVEQWTDVHGTDAIADATETIHGHRRTTYAGPAGKPVVELYEVAGLPHAVAVDPGTGPQQGGTVGQYSRAADLCSAYRSLAFWGLAP
jgi:poly(hydroxyalkanoate) depolymerase family esterase